MQSLEIFVQSVPARRERVRRLADELHAMMPHGAAISLRSLEQPPEVSTRDFFLSILDEMAASSAEYVIRLEDDVILNRHFFHNIATWPALQAENFGCGWLWCSEIFLKERASYGIEERCGLFEIMKPIWGSLGAVFKTEHMAAIRKLADSTVLLPGRHGKSQDSALSGATLRAGLRVFLHVPSLVEHDISVKSAFGHKFVPGYGQAGPCFDHDWKRVASSASTPYTTESS